MTPFDRGGRVTRTARLVVVLIAAALAIAVAWSTPMGTEFGPVPDAPSYVLQAIEIRSGNWTSIPPVGEVGQTDPDPTLRYPSRYPPGFPALLAGVAVFTGGDAQGMQHASRLTVALLIVAGVLLAALLGGWVAGVLAAVAFAVAPFVIDSMRVVMADAASGLVVVLLAILLVGLRRRRFAWHRPALCITAGVLVACAIVIKLALVVLLAPVLLALGLRRSSALALLPVAIALLALGLYQWTVFGSPLTTGYTYWVPDGPSFSASSGLQWRPAGDGPWVFGDRLDGAAAQWACPCRYPGEGAIADLPALLLYPLVLIGAVWVFAPPLWMVPAIYWVVRFRHTPVARFVAGLAVLLLVLYGFYDYVGVRFLTPVGALMIPIGSAGIADFWRRAVGPRPFRV